MLKVGGIYTRENYTYIILYNNSKFDKYFICSIQEIFLLSNENVINHLGRKMWRDIAKDAMYLDYFYVSEHFEDKNLAYLGQIPNELLKELRDEVNLIK